MSSSGSQLTKTFSLFRNLGMVVLALHIYLVCYAAFAEWGLASGITDRIFLNLSRNGLFADFHKPRLAAFALLAVSFVGMGGGSGDSRRPVRPARIIGFLVAGAGLYFLAPRFFYGDWSPRVTALGYIGATGVGYCLFWYGGGLLASLRHNPIRDDIFNSLNESFPQERRLLVDECSINLPTRYRYEGRMKKGWINIDPFRGLLVMGSSGSAKTWCVIRSIIRQHLEKGFAMVVYDFKYDDLSRLTWHYYRLYKANYEKKPRFYVINFRELSRSHRCNPLGPTIIRDMADASEAARTILMGLNPDFVERQGDFWIESANSFLTALIWYLRKVEGGRHCTLPHVIELLQVDYADLFSILRTEPDIASHINPFVLAYVRGVKETLDNQLASLKIALSRLSSPALYYVMTGDDFTLDINNPLAPKVLCLGSDPRVSTTYGAVISLYITAINRLVNRRGGLRSSHIYDEMPTVRIHQLNELLATGRSNQVAVTMCVQDASQLRLHYGRAQADVILNLPGSIISGQVGGDTARVLSERIGKVVQLRHSVHESAAGSGGASGFFSGGASGPSVSVSHSTNLDYAVPVSRISTLSSGEFVGFVADNPRRPVAQKAFHCRILPDPDPAVPLAPLPLVRQVTPGDVQAHFLAVKADIAGLVSSHLALMLRTPAFTPLILNSERV
ncbi:MAG TPA: YWFCY domain-containing protein [Puia sp.]|uniref:YWFCY domain-containing protein n=1 Tax=Puia sp. TaxID=2045100 RepID=UPI002C23EF51|nr:YWFCY domain-containing protein [Puia sp.]HVU97983.1 YWFCY domain-containing protein [Puia sp.]